MLEQLADLAQFSTGIEGSYNKRKGIRRNQLREAANFYHHYKQRLSSIKELGIQGVRFGDFLPGMNPREGVLQFGFTDLVLEECEKLGLQVQYDLIHFGLPSWMHHKNPEAPYFQNRDFAHHVAHLAHEVAKRYPHIKYWTPCNEPFITANMSAYNGAWNEELTGDEPYVRAAANIARAGIRIMEHIKWANPNAVFLQNESCEQAYAHDACRVHDAQHFNKRRFVPLDLMLGHHDEHTEQYVRSHGLSEQEYKYFMDHGRATDVVIGIDNYPSCYKDLHASGGERLRTATDTLDLASMITTWWERYQRPLLHMETNATPEHQESILNYTYTVINTARTNGIPVLGMNYFGDEVQIGWSTGLTTDYPALYIHDEHRVGLFYKGKPDPAAHWMKANIPKGLAPLALPPMQQKAA